MSASVRIRSQASASVRNRSQASAIVRGASDLPERRKSSRNAEQSSLFTFRITKVSTVTGIGGVVVAKRRTVVTFGLVSGLRVSKVSTVTGIGGSWSRNAELSSLLDSSRLFASQKCQQSQGSGGSWSRNAELSSLLALPLERGEERGDRRKER